MVAWNIEKLIAFDFEVDFVKDGLAHFGFHDRTGRFYAISHQRHFMGLVGKSGQLEWTAAKGSVFTEVPNIPVPLDFPIFTDCLADGSLVVSNFGDSRLYRVYPDLMKAELLVDGKALGIRRAGNCVVDEDDCIWLNEVEGCRIRRFDREGRLLLTLGNGAPGFSSRPVGFDRVTFNWIYDIRKGPDGNIYVLDSRNFAVRVIDLGESRVRTVAGTGRSGYTGDGGDPIKATFGIDPSTMFDGPISLSIDEGNNIYVGDRYNGVVRMIEKESNEIITIAGDPKSKGEAGNVASERNPLGLRLPKISSMDYYDGRLYVPTDFTYRSGDLVVLQKAVDG